MRPGKFDRCPAQPWLRPALVGLLLVLGGSSWALARQAQEARPATPEEILIGALASNPVTSPYLFHVERQGNRLVLSGRVGTTAIYNVAVRTAIATGLPFDDRLVIDTSSLVVPPQGAMVAGPVPTSALFPSAQLPTFDPLFGFADPPVIQYPPWWPALSARRLGQMWVGGDPAAAPGDQAIAAAPLPEDSVELTIDPMGFGRLRGRVASREDAQAIAERAARLPGVRGVINNLQIDGEPQPAAAANGAMPDQPPPRPVPFDQNPPAGSPSEARPAAPAPPAPGPDPTLGQAADPVVLRAGNAVASLTDRVREALQRRPELRDLQFDVQARDGTITLSGEAPSIVEAMVAFRAAQQVPGVNQIVDRIAYPPPQPNRPNPLLAQAGPDHIEPYLLDQIRRHIGDLAHVDDVQLDGDRLVIRGSMRQREDEPRLAAILRTLPALRGVQISPQFTIQ